MQYILQTLLIFMMKKILFILFVLLSNISFANIFNVGSTQQYISPNSLYLANVLQNGDTIDIDAETYIGISALAAVAINF